MNCSSEARRSDDRRREAAASIRARTPSGRSDRVERSRGAARRADSRIVRAPPRRVPREHADRVVQLALDLLVREPDIEGFFGALRKTMVEESESHACARVADRREPVSAASCGWRTSKDRLLTLRTRDRVPDRRDPLGFPCESMAGHSSPTRRAGRRRSSTDGDDPRLPEPVREFSRTSRMRTSSSSTPLVLGTRTLGWMTLSRPRRPELRGPVVARGPASKRLRARRRWRCTTAGSSSCNRLEERRKAILEERNRLARDIHDNLAQGFAAILMQLQGAQREAGRPAAGRRVEASRPRSIWRART